MVHYCCKYFLQYWDCIQNAYRDTLLTKLNKSAARTFPHRFLNLLGTLLLHSQSPAASSATAVQGRSQDALALQK